jgi:hypothetical protein
MEESCGAVKNRHRTFYTTMPKRISKNALDAVGVSSLHEFKKLKRAQMRAVLSAFKEFRRASAFVPGYDYGRVSRIEDALTSWQRQMRTNRWVV